MACALQFLDEERTALNAKNPIEGKVKRKAFRLPYYSPYDERFKVCVETGMYG